VTSEPATLAPRPRPGTHRPTLADVTIATLKASGVRRIYGLPGDSLNGLTDAIRRDGEITWLHVRHEESAAFAAAAEAGTTGGLAVCAASCGPGNLHLINGLFDAQRSRVPVLAIAAHIPRTEIGTGYFQETHPQELFRECSVYAEMVSVADQLPRLLQIAMGAAVERRGVAVVVIPGEILQHEALRGTTVTAVRPTTPIIRPSDDEIAAAAEVLNRAGAVTILAGAGCEGAHDELVAVAERLRAPVVHAMRGKEFVEYDNPYDVGMTGLLGFTSGYRAMEHCDALLMLGTDFPYPPFLPDAARIVQVDVRGENIGRRVPVDVALVGTVRDTVRALLPRLHDGADGAHLDRMLAHYRRTRRRLDALAVSTGDRGPLHPQAIAAALDRLGAEDAVFVPDVGTPTLWAARYLRMNGRRRLIGSFGHGTMANALPHAIGAQAAHPGRQVVALSGDGGPAMLLGELLTLRQHRLPMKVVVLNNGALSFVEGPDRGAVHHARRGTGLRRRAERHLPHRRPSDPGRRRGVGRPEQPGDAQRRADPRRPCPGRRDLGRALHARRDGRAVRGRLAGRPRLVALHLPAQRADRPRGLLGVALRARGRPITAQVSLDVPGALLAVVGLGAVIYAMTAGPASGWNSVPVLISGVVGFVCLVALVPVERRQRQPIIELALFRIRQFTAINAATILFYGALAAASYLVVLQCELRLGYSATAAGAALIPESVVFLLVSPLVGGIVARVGIRWPMEAGILITAGGFCWLSTARIGESYAQAILPGAILWGLGIGVTVAPLTAGVLAAVDDTDLGQASAINDAASRVGGVVMVALVPALLGAGDAQSLAAPLAAHYGTAMLVMAALSVAAAVITAAFVTRSLPATARHPVVTPRVHGCAFPTTATATARRSG
jgi:pyruvate dehydrogenase (quinone)